jgi:hypothetical protein
MNYKRPTTWILQLIGIIVLGYCVYGALMQTAYFEQKGKLLVGLGLYLSLVAPAILLLRAVRISRKQSRLMEPVEMEITPDFFKIKGESYNYEYSWNKIEQVRDTHFAYLVYLSKVQAHILPKYALSKNEEIQLRESLSSISGLKLKFKKID